MKIEEIITEFKEMLLDIATYYEEDSSNYKKLRKELMNYDNLKSVLPKFIKFNGTPSSFRSYIQEVGGFKERRKVINQGFSKIYESVEIKSKKDLLDISSANKTSSKKRIIEIIKKSGESFEKLPGTYSEKKKKL